MLYGIFKNNIENLTEVFNMKIVSADEMREIDRRAIEEYGIPGIVLMENAGRAAADSIEDMLIQDEIDSVLIIAGKGNNGGDGFVAARHLVNRGVDSSVLLIGKVDEVKGDARINLDIILKMGMEVREIVTDISIIEEDIRSAGLLVDALFGTGLRKEVSGFYAEVIEAINMSDLPVISLDIPSGLDASTGRVLGVSIEADRTVTFCLPKIGTVLHPGADCVGDLILADIGAPDDLLIDRQLKTSLILQEDAAEVLLPRDENSHKGSYGHLLIVAGSRGKTGAAVMAAEAAMRGGTGLVTLAAP
jgi:NAD(P)H-hydrate epimerase